LRPILLNGIEDVISRPDPGPLIGLGASSAKSSKLSKAKIRRAPKNLPGLSDER
jgi:hypothetical protein